MMNPKPIRRRVDPDALAEAGELYHLLNEIHPEANDLEITTRIARSFSWGLAETAHLMAYLALVEDSSYNTLTDANYETVFAGRLAIIHDRIEAVLPSERLVEFGAYDVESVAGIGEVPIDNLEATAVKGHVVFSRNPDFLSEVIESPTWLDIAVIANESIVETGDREHVILQGVADTGRVREDGVAVYELVITK